MIVIKSENEAGTFPLGNTFTVTHNRGNFPDKVYVWGPRNRPIFSSAFTIAQDSPNQFTLTFSDAAEFSGRYEALFTHLTIVQEGVAYDVKVKNGSLFVQEVSPPPDPPELVAPPDNA